MNIQTAGRHVFSTALVATFLLCSVLATAQEGRIQSGSEVALPVKGGCPKPLAVTLNATTPNVFNADFTPGMLAAPRSFLNDPAPNKSFLYTFQWASQQRCCEITRATLTVKMKANQSCSSATSPDAGNDGIAIMVGTALPPPFSGPVYTQPCSAGQTVTKSWPLSGAALSSLKANRRLSVYVQDDTMVQSAALEIWGCCLSEPGRDSVEEAQPIRREN